MAIPSTEQIRAWADHVCSAYGSPPCETATGHHDTRRRLALLVLALKAERDMLHGSCLKWQAELERAVDG